MLARVGCSVVRLARARLNSGGFPEGSLGMKMAWRHKCLAKKLDLKGPAKKLF